MKERNAKSYYALVWSNALENNVELKGNPISKNVKLPNDPRMLYGTNENDVFKVVKDVVHEKISYDVLTMKQSVEFYVEQVEYIMPRDVRILVWEGSSTLMLPNESYRIMTPQMFEEFVSDKCELQDVTLEKSFISKGLRMPKGFSSALRLSYA